MPKDYLNQTNSYQNKTNRCLSQNKKRKLNEELKNFP